MLPWLKILSFFLQAQMGLDRFLFNTELSIGRLFQKPFQVAVIAISVKKIRSQISPRYVIHLVYRYSVIDNSVIVVIQVREGNFRGIDALDSRDTVQAELLFSRSVQLFMI